MYALSIQDDGKIVVGGNFNEYNGDATGQDIAHALTQMVRSMKPLSLVLVFLVEAMVLSTLWQLKTTVK